MAANEILEVHDFRGQDVAENSPSNTTSPVVSTTSLKRSRSLATCDSELSEGMDKFSWRNNGPVRRVKRNVKWAFQLESSPAPDFVKRTPVFGLSKVKSILKRTMGASSVSKETLSRKPASAKLDSPVSALAEPSTNSDVSSQFEEDVCDGEEQDQKPRRTKFKLMLNQSL